MVTSPWYLVVQSSADIIHAHCSNMYYIADIRWIQVSEPQIDRSVFTGRYIYIYRCSWPHHFPTKPKKESQKNSQGLRELNDVEGATYIGQQIQQQIQQISQWMPYPHRLCLLQQCWAAGRQGNASVRTVPRRRHGPVGLGQTWVHPKQIWYQTCISNPWAITKQKQVQLYNIV